MYATPGMFGSASAVGGTAAPAAGAAPAAAGAGIGLGAGLGLGLLGFGMAFSFFSQRRATQQQAAMYKYNRNLMKMYARAIRELRSYEERRFLAEAAKLPRKQKVLITAAGLEISGTPLAVMKETLKKIAEQAKMMRYGKEMEVGKIMGGAALSGFQADLARTQGRMAALGTLLTGAGEIGLMGYQQGWWGRAKTPSTV